MSSSSGSALLALKYPGGRGRRGDRVPRGDRRVRGVDRAAGAAPVSRSAAATLRVSSVLTALTARRKRQRIGRERLVVDVTDNPLGQIDLHLPEAIQRCRELDLDRAVAST